MNSFITGFFTLVAALSAIWLKDHLDNKKVSKSTVKQKAIEAYTLTNRLTHSLNASMVICAGLLRDKNYNYSELEKRNPNTSFDDLAKLELIIVENFYDLNLEFLVITGLILAQSRFLLNIMMNVKNDEFKLDASSFEKNNNQFGTDIVNACNKLRESLIDKYINKNEPHANIFDCIDSIKKFMKNFFARK